MFLSLLERCYWLQNCPTDFRIILYSWIFPVSSDPHLSLQTDPLKKNFRNYNFLGLSSYQKTTIQSHSLPSMTTDWKSSAYSLIFLPIMKWHFSSVLLGLCWLPQFFWKCSHEIIHLQIGTHFPVLPPLTSLLTSFDYLEFSLYSGHFPHAPLSGTPIILSQSLPGFFSPICCLNTDNF